MFQNVKYTTDENTYECFLKIRENLKSFPEIERIYNEQCMQKSISSQYGGDRKGNNERDVLLNYALTIYVNSHIAACNVIDSNFTHIEWKDEFLFIFINEITQGRKILFNFIPIEKLPSRMDEELKYEIIKSQELESYKSHQVWIKSGKIYNYYVQNTRTAYLNFVQCSYNYHKPFKPAFEQMFTQIIEECKLYGYKMPPKNTYLRIGLKEHFFEFLVCDVVGIPKVSLGYYGLEGIKAVEDIPMIIITGYYNYHGNKSNTQSYKSW